MATSSPCSLPTDAQVPQWTKKDDDENLSSPPEEQPAQTSDSQNASNVTHLPQETSLVTPPTVPNSAADDDTPPPAAPPTKSPYALVALPEVPECARVSDRDIQLLHEAHFPNPFGLLGAHVFSDPAEPEAYFIVVRAWVIDAWEISIRSTSTSDFTIVSKSEWTSMTKASESLFHVCFRYVAESAILPSRPDNSAFLDYQLRVHIGASETVIWDPFSFGCILSDYDLQLFQSGSCWHVDNLLGSHIDTVRGIKGVRFAVWAPSARFVSVVGDFNGWDGRRHPMRNRHSFGVWEIFLPCVGPNEKYGYKIHTTAGTDLVKIDPFAQEFEVPPKTASIISSCDDPFKPESERFQWEDTDWMEKRANLGREDMVRRQPMIIYEVHLPSWMRRRDGGYLGYRELADRLVVHVRSLGFTHVEFLPIAHHPFEGSWGYQVTGQYAPYSRLGKPDDFKYLVNLLHTNGIGVFLDFVPAHFCKDEWGLAMYDGTPCFEYGDPREGEHRQWGTLVYNFSRNEVRSYLLGACYHWLRRYHIDGLRIDAVSSMLYRNYMRKPGEWIPNEHGGDANLEAISLLQEMNWVIRKEFPGVFTMAEESTAWQGVCDRSKGLGFDAKWDLGWMNDTLSYLCTPVEQRPSKHNKLTFRGLYLGHENWILPLSHDEVVSGKGSLLDKCGFLGCPFEERMHNLRALYGLQFGLPGRPLVFMGGEIAQGREWKNNRSVDWHEGEEELRKKCCVYISDLTRVCRFHKALHAGDDESWNFQWVDCDNASDCVVAFLRKYAEWYQDVLVVCNFSGVTYYRYPIGVPHGGEWEVLINSDDWRYGGGMRGPGNLSRVHSEQGGRMGWPYCLWFDLPPFGCLFLRPPQPPEANASSEVEAGFVTTPAVPQPTSPEDCADSSSLDQKYLVSKTQVD